MMIRSFKYSCVIVVVCVLQLFKFDNAHGQVAVAQCGDDPPSAEQQFDALRIRYEAQLKRFYAEAGKAKTEEERYKFGLENYPANTMVNDFLGLEEQKRKKNTLVGLSALHQVVSAGGYPGPDSPSSLGVEKALRILTEHYADHADVDLFFFWLSWDSFSKETKSLLQRASESPHRHVRGTALLSLAQMLAFEAQQLGPRADSVLELVGGDTEKFAAEFKYYSALRQQFRGVDPESSRREALLLMDRIISEYPEVLESPRTTYGPILLRVSRSPEDPLTLRKRRPLADIVASTRFQLTQLGIGAPAPEIAGPDALGNELKLSDQRGKVTVLMFSFKGCGPCEGMYPDNRTLIEKYKERPFAFVGVMGDTELATVKEAVEQGKITWPVWWDGKLKGPIATRWNVSAWPEIYVLDHKGVIRYRELRGPLLERAIARLVESAERDR